jgi:hypothetical protein
MPDAVRARVRLRTAGTSGCGAYRHENGHKRDAISGCGRFGWPLPQRSAGGGEMPKRRRSSVIVAIRARWIDPACMRHSRS